MNETKRNAERISIGEHWNEPVRFTIDIVKDGNCRAGHKAGQEFAFEWNTPEGICSEAFVGMYPVLHSLRVLGDMRELGSDKRNERIYTCPSRVIQFSIVAHYGCNICGSELNIVDGEIRSKRLENPDENLWVRVCDNCFDKYRNKTLKW
jgi:uncharacterized repeat protein (TIGR04076 family)